MDNQKQLESLVNDIRNLADELCQERKQNFNKTYTITEVIELLDGLTNNIE